MQKRLGTKPLPLQISIGEGSTGEKPFEGIIDLIEQKAMYFDPESKGKDFDVREIPAEMQEDAILWRGELLDELARSRIYFSAVTAEGFGLIPLEAMSLGCIVLGLDGHGSRDYLRHGENSFCVKLKNLRLLPGLFNEIVDSLDEMDSIVDNAIETASYYSYERFRLAWTKVLERFL